MLSTVLIITSQLIVCCQSTSLPIVVIIPETAVVSVFNNIARFIDDNNQISALVLLDLSAAFDTVDHAILVSVLEKHVRCSR